MAFPYPPLPGGDALRLLTLKAGAFFDPLEADLAAVAFSARPQYLALSYTWGDPTSEQPSMPVDFTKVDPNVPDDNSDYLEPASCRKEGTLALNGHDVPIGHNLAMALRHVRSASHPLTIWVDAVCINQADIDERNSQVALMSLIYSRAVAVVCWMGLNVKEVMGALPTFDEDGGIQAGMAMRNCYNLGNSKELGSWFAGHKAAQADIGSRYVAESRDAEKEALEAMAAVNQQGDYMVMKTGYWQRIWVVQEVCLAQRNFFVYGPTLMIDEEVVRYAYQMNQLKEPTGMKSMMEARKRRFGDTMRLGTLIEDFAAQRCAEPRDKIYGLLGLANDISAVEGPGDDDAIVQDSGDEDVEFIVDYRRSFYAVWCDAVQYLFRCPYYFVPAHLDKDEGELRRLRHERLTNVVRFAGIVQNTLEDEVERELAGLTASSSASDMQAILRGRQLFGRYLLPVRGYLAGKILDLGPTYTDFVRSGRQQKAWTAKWRKHYRKEPDLVKLRQMEETYSAKILKYSEADAARVAPIRGEPFVAFFSPDDGPLDTLTAAPADVDGETIMNNMLSTLATKDIPEAPPDAPVNRFLGTDHCMGLAPAGAAIGDWVLRFWDCDAAIVVRPDNESDPESPCALIGRADVADIRDRKGIHGDVVANEALTRHPYGAKQDKRMDMVMTWHTLQRITASIIT
ncbi:heterokaryon incompatibility protein-domain-containing protein [Nemania sp. FL0916]|nr:heterokaryon incompatibility protein-domain-containing protein [Nemania sp. FL0916]